MSKAGWYHEAEAVVLDLRIRDFFIISHLRIPFFTVRQEGSQVLNYE